MAFYLKKSLCFRPIRFNLSGSGIGVSAGVKGFRVALSCVVIITLFSTMLRSAETGSDPKAQVADVPIKAEAEVTAEAEVSKAAEPKAAPSSVEIARRLRRIGNSWVLNVRDRETFSFAITNQWQGKVCAGPSVREVSPLGLLVEHESGEFWCSWDQLPIETRQKYQAILAQAERNKSTKVVDAISYADVPLVVPAAPVSKSSKPTISSKPVIVPADVAEKKQQEKARLQKFLPLVEGKIEPETPAYYYARIAVEQVVENGDLASASDAREVLDYAQQITKYRLQGLSTTFERSRITDRLNRLLDRGVLR